MARAPQPLVAAPSAAWHTGLVMRNAWDLHAGEWISWARAPGHDSCWRFHREAFLLLVPPPGRLTVDIGCGEGRLTRDLSRLGHRVLGIDAVSDRLAGRLVSPVARASQVNARTRPMRQSDETSAKRGASSDDALAPSPRSRGGEGDVGEDGIAARSAPRASKKACTVAAVRPDAAHAHVAAAPFRRTPVCQGPAGAVARAARPTWIALAGSWKAPAALVSSPPWTSPVPSSASAPGVPTGPVQYFAVALRSFLRLCLVEGLVGINLPPAALAVTGRRRSSLPMGISHADATALLGSCDRRRSDGRRDCSRAPARTRHVPPGPAGCTFVIGIGGYCIGAMMEMGRFICPP